MRKLDAPLTDDRALLERLRASDAESAIAIRPHIDAMRNRYETYEQNNGDPWRVNLDNTFANVRSELQHLYKKPVAALGFIKTLRNSLKGACPVCGRDSLGTLDHYLPKADYSEFSFFSRNLVPACDRCTNARGNDVMGPHPGQRPLHPYYDAFAQRRIMSVRLEPDWRAPCITPIPFDVTGDEFAIVQWHIDHVIRPAGIDDYLIDLWGNLVTEPTTFFSDVKGREDVLDFLNKQVGIETVHGKSHNCWRSCFYHGLALNNDAIDYLTTLI